MTGHCASNDVCVQSFLKTNLGQSTLSLDLYYCLRCLLMLVVVHSASARLSQGKPPLAWASLPLSSAASERPLPVRPSLDLTRLD